MPLTDHTNLILGNDAVSKYRSRIVIIIIYIPVCWARKVRPSPVYEIGLTTKNNL